MTITTKNNDTMRSALNPLALAVTMSVATLGSTGVARAACNPCNPCAAKKSVEECIAGVADACNPCNPCAVKAVNACKNPCAACNPCNPCAAKT